MKGNELTTVVILMLLLSAIFLFVARYSKAPIIEVVCEAGSEVEVDVPGAYGTVLEFKDCTPGYKVVVID